MAFFIEFSIDFDSFIAMFIRFRFSLTLVFQLEVGTLAVGESTILINANGLLQSVVVGTIIGDVQLTVAVHHREVSTTIDTTRMLRTHGDEVTVVKVIECRCGIAIDGSSIGIALVAVR